MGAGRPCCIAANKQNPEDVIGGTRERADFTSAKELLDCINLFDRLLDSDKEIIAKSLVRVSYEPGNVIILQGDAGAEFFIILVGLVAVEVDGVKVAELREGDHFGERALLRNEPRVATIRCVQSTVAFSLTRERFRRLGLHHKLKFPKRPVIMPGKEEAADEPPPPTEKTDLQRRAINQALRNNKVFNDIFSFQQNDERCNRLADRMWLKTLKEDEIVIHEGDQTSDYFYIVQAGRLKVFKNLARTHHNHHNHNPPPGNKRISRSEHQVVQEHQEHQDNDCHLLKLIDKGASFGELALLFNIPRAATVQALEEASVWVLDRKTFQEVLLTSAKSDIVKNFALINQVPEFRLYSTEEKQELAGMLSETIYQHGQIIVTQGEEPDMLRILYDGEVGYELDGEEESQHPASVAKILTVGMDALKSARMGAAPEPFTVRVRSVVAHAMCIDRDRFNTFMVSLDELLLRNPLRPESWKLKDTACVPARATGKVAFDDLEAIGVIGVGSLATVTLMEYKKELRKTYALKTISKNEVIAKGLEVNIMREKEIQLMCDSPFVIQLFETYKRDGKLHFLLEPAIAGDLWTIYSRKGLHGSLLHARFYTASMAMALTYLHRMYVVYRDLKPENILLSADGIPKLTDFGLAKRTGGKSYTACGSLDFLAPELVRSEGHDRAVDWWALGILVFELLIGHAPFQAANHATTCAKILKGFQEVVFPVNVTETSKQIIMGLCEELPPLRIPMGHGVEGGLIELQKHPWFADFNWEDLASKHPVHMPYMPKLKGYKDVDFLKKYAATVEKPLVKRVKDPRSGWDAGFATSE
eukprot:TRINITY_DN46097_c0_g1_i1.p1 TRINITY_DN46097_c0_g1~~TRINITY_DN46097_c0_g1_i1.p1  ORF type:complete len:851 (+),score=179.99 TRINITY_DN46097_c0_g1_i1:108-2555(+)